MEYPKNKIKEKNLYKKKSNVQIKIPKEIPKNKKPSVPKASKKNIDGSD